MIAPSSYRLIPFSRQRAVTPCRFSTSSHKATSSFLLKSALRCEIKGKEDSLSSFNRSFFDRQR